MDIELTWILGQGKQSVGLLTLTSIITISQFIHPGVGNGVNWVDEGDGYFSKLQVSLYLSKLLSDVRSK